MEITHTPLAGCFVAKLNRHGDDRGFFMESFNQKWFDDMNLAFSVKQVNFAKSQKNVLRGLHYQAEPMAQSKFVGVINGAVLDVVVDLRSSSKTYLKYFKIILENPTDLLFVPKGFAHGYYTLEDETIFYYAVDNYYSPENERGVRFDDPVLGIDWELKETPIISEKDIKQSYLNI